jgi:hypothetical protein
VYVQERLVCLHEASDWLGSGLGHGTDPFSTRATKSVGAEGACAIEDPEASAVDFAGVDADGDEPADEGPANEGPADEQLASNSGTARRIPINLRLEKLISRTPLYVKRGNSDMRDFQFCDARDKSTPDCSERR